MSSIPSNKDLVEERLAISRAQKEARHKVLQEAHEKNLQWKQRFNNSDDATALYAIKVSVCEELRNELRLNGREKRGRHFIEKGSNGTKSLSGLKFEMHSFFRALRKSSYILTATLPSLNLDATAETAAGGSSSSTGTWILETDHRVVDAFAKAEAHFQQQSGAALQRPTICIHVSKDPNAPPPPPPPAYLENMPNPLDSTSQTMLSFYAFPPNGLDDPHDMASILKKVWTPFRALGRVYVAREGINAQMSVPTNVVQHFVDACLSIPQVGDYIENGINLDPIPISNEEFAVAGVPVRGKPAPPFSALHIRVRTQVVADGLDHALDWQQAGYDMPPLEWHAKLKNQGIGSCTDDISTTKPILLDCRNSFETNVGSFDGAEPLGTESFRDSWNVLKARLKDTPKDAPIMTYCTGGIRCVKVGAYLTQELGFTNVARLAGGIIAYDRTLKEQAPDETPLFKGTNFVFDGRLGRPMTDDDLASCSTCGAETSLVINCRNANCHKRIIQCENCQSSFQGTCSEACHQRIQNGNMLAQRRSSSRTTNDDEPPVVFQSLEEYSVGHSTPPPSFYREMEFNTRVLLPTGAHMVSGAAQGRWLTQLASMTREGRILELGTFTGYATACLLEGASNVGDCLNYVGVGSRRGGGPYVMSLERDSRALQVAMAHLSIMTKHGTGEHGAEAACALRAAGGVLPTIDDNRESIHYKTAACDVIQVTDALATVEEMAQGKGELQPAPFDMVFVDADKTRLVEYVEALVSTDRLLKKGGLIVVDNVLWKGLVLEAGMNVSRQYEQEIKSDDEIRKTRRARQLANKMHRFNSEIVKDNRVEVLILPMRDGLSVIRKR